MEKNPKWVNQGPLPQGPKEMKRTETKTAVIALKKQTTKIESP